MAAAQAIAPKAPAVLEKLPVPTGASMPASSLLAVLFFDKASISNVF